MRSRISETNRVRSYDTRQSRGASRAALSGPTPKAMIDKFALLPIVAYIYSLIVSHLMTFLAQSGTPTAENTAADARWDTRIFWPAMAAISIILTTQNLSRLVLPPNIKCLFAYLAFAGVSVLWAFSQDHSLMRYIQQVMIVVSIVPPAMLASRTVDMMRAMFLCVAVALFLNLYFVSQGSAMIVMYTRGS